MDVGLSRDGCIPRWEVGEPRGEEVTWPDESVQRERKKRRRSVLTASVVFHIFKTRPAITITAIHIHFCGGAISHFI